MRPCGGANLPSTPRLPEPGDGPTSPSIIPNKHVVAAGGREAMGGDVGRFRMSDFVVYWVGWPYAGSANAARDITLS
jgi:hypothetical protein